MPRASFAWEQFFQLKPVPDGVHHGVLEHRVDAVERPPVRAVHLGLERAFRHIGERQTPALQDVLEIPVSLPLDISGVRGRPDVGVGKLQLFARPNQVAPRGPQEVDEEVLETEDEPPPPWPGARPAAS